MPSLSCSRLWGGTHVPRRRPCRARCSRSQLGHPPERGVPLSSPPAPPTGTRRTPEQQPESDQTVRAAERSHHDQHRGGPNSDNPSLTGRSGAADGLRASLARGSLGRRPAPNRRYAATPPTGSSVLRNAGTPRGQSHGRVRVLCGTPALAPRGLSGAAVDATRDHRAPGPRHHAGYGVGDADLAPTIIEWARVPSARRSKVVVVGRVEDHSGMLICSWRSKRYASPEVSGTPGQTQNSLPAFESSACRCRR
jgi:hypothetical protein